MRPADMRTCILLNDKNEGAVYYFHTFSLCSGEVKDGVVTRAIAIVEDEQGQIHEIKDVEKIKFNDYHNNIQ